MRSGGAGGVGAVALRAVSIGMAGLVLAACTSSPEQGAATGAGVVVASDTGATATAGNPSGDPSDDDSSPAGPDTDGSGSADPTAPGSSTPVPATPAPATPASTTPASTTPASTTPASTTPASTTQAPTTPATSSAQTPTKPQSTTPPRSSRLTSAAVPNAGSPQTAAALTVIAAAERAVSGGTVFDLESDTEGAGVTWDARVADASGTEFEVRLDAAGAALGTPRRESSPSDDIPKLRGARVSLPAALGIAVGRAQGQGEVSSVEIDTAGASNTVVWQVGFGGDDGTTVVVDAADGTVLAVGRDAG